MFASNHSLNQRRGKVLVLVGLLLTVLLGMTALAVDLGLIMMTRAQLQSSSDSGSLAGGTELLPGLGASAFRTPAQVQILAQAQAVAYVAKHPAGEATSTHIDAARDTKFGTARMNKNTGEWTFTWGATPYNAVGVTTLRSNVGNTSGDKPLPLIFAPILGTNRANVTTDSVAVIMPASGISIPPGSGLSSGLAPFAFSQQRWDKYWRARRYFISKGFTANDLTQANGGHLIPDPDDLDSSGNPNPLFYEKGLQGNQVTYKQLFDDRYTTDYPDQDISSISSGGEGTLELNIYPINSQKGNFGTVDVGPAGNSTADLVRQIKYGVSETDMSYLANNTLDPENNPGTTLEGDTGISAGIEAALESIVGHKRTIVLYSTVHNPGNNATYTLTQLVGIRIMAVNLHGQTKVLVVQPESVSDPAGLPDYDDTIGNETTFFTPLILAK